jgi:hypothetical protein
LRERSSLERRSCGAPPTGIEAHQLASRQLTNCKLQRHSMDATGLLVDPAVRKFVDWVASKDPDFTATSRKHIGRWARQQRSLRPTTARPATLQQPANPVAFASQMMRPRRAD